MCSSSCLLEIKLPCVVMEEEDHWPSWLHVDHQGWCSGPLLTCELVYFLLYQQIALLMVLWMEWGTLDQKSYDMLPLSIFFQNCEIFFTYSFPGWQFSFDGKQHGLLFTLVMGVSRCVMISAIEPLLPISFNSTCHPVVILLVLQEVTIFTKLSGLVYITSCCDFDIVLGLT